jgi:hypothetical protein
LLFVTARHGIKNKVYLEADIFEDRVFILIRSDFVLVELFHEERSLGAAAWFDLGDLEQLRVPHEQTSPFGTTHRGVQQGS